MNTTIARESWRRRGAHGDCHPKRKRERRPAGFLSPNAAKLRRLMKRRSHRHARRTARAELRARVATLTA